MPTNPKQHVCKPGFHCIFTPIIRRGGKVLVAASYGLKAFRICVAD